MLFTISNGYAWSDNSPAATSPRRRISGSSLLHTDNHPPPNADHATRPSTIHLDLPLTSLHHTPVHYNKYPTHFPTQLKTDTYGSGNFFPDMLSTHPQHLQSTFCSPISLHPTSLLPFISNIIINAFSHSPSTLWLHRNEWDWVMKSVKRNQQICEKKPVLERFWGKSKQNKDMTTSVENCSNFSTPACSTQTTSQLHMQITLPGPVPYTTIYHSLHPTIPRCIITSIPLTFPRISKSTLMGPFDLKFCPLVFHSYGSGTLPDYP
jgi:hypothetical protein